MPDTSLLTTAPPAAASALSQRIPADTASRLAQAGAWLVLVAMLAGMPALLDSYWTKVAISAVIYTIAATGVATLYARLGLVCLAQVALVGVGGWCCLRVAHASGWPFELAMLVAACITALAGILVGLPALRMRGLYFALVSMMAAGGFAIVVTVIQFPNGGAGLVGYGFDPQPMPRPFLAQSDQALLRYVLVMALLCFAVVHCHLRRAPGRAWAFIRRSEAVAMAAGVDVTTAKIHGFALAGFLAGIAGSLLAASQGMLDARSFPASESILLFALTIVGGAYGFLGQIISGLLYRVVPALLDSAGLDGNLGFVVFGVALLHALITAPDGIAGQLQHAGRMLVRKLRP